MWRPGQIVSRLSLYFNPRYTVLVFGCTETAAIAFKAKACLTVDLERR